MGAIAIQIGRAAAQRAVPMIIRCVPRATGGAGREAAADEVEKRRAEANRAKSSPLAMAEVTAWWREK